MTQEPASVPGIKIEALTKLYGDQAAVKNLSLTIARGEIFGFIGPNGAGKTTTIRILAGLLKPTQGNAHVMGVDVRRHPGRVKELVGYMPDAFGVYENMTLREYLDFFAAAFRIPRAERKTIIANVLALTDLTDKSGDQVSAFSKGMKQRACLAKTLLHNPEVLILDEPAAGLDPRARIELRELLRELKRMGKTILVSSHILAELSAVCDSVGIIEQGKLVASGSVAEILRSLRSHREFILKLLRPDDSARATKLLEDQRGVQQVEDLGGELRLRLEATEEEIGKLVEALAAASVTFTEFREELVDLETAFMTLTQGKLA